uniref:Pept_C1 domain-containing protein n=1 Tax=Angiostrongylus cantonensis TaxID=6313 RepID=A0A158PAN0_ANGCA
MWLISFNKKREDNAFEPLRKHDSVMESHGKGYNKSYSSDGEKAFRYSVFVKNVAYFEEEELKHPEVDLDVTKFADWTDEEMIKILSGDKQETKTDDSQQRFDSSVMGVRDGRPVELDWVKAGKVTAVKDQGQCGSCWAFAAVASVESAYAIVKGPLVRLSEQELIDCDTQNYGCNGGFRPYAMRLRIFHFQTDPKKLVEKNTHTSICVDRVFIHDYRTLSPNEEIIADWIATKGPVTFGMNVTKPLYSYRSGIFSPSKEDCEKDSLGSHALIFVGYGTDSGGERYWLVKNSWGSRWGQNGYFKLARGRNACGAANSVVTPIIEQN